jgi:D-alanyl-D-alanine carboxypeptidase
MLFRPVTFLPALLACVALPCTAARPDVAEMDAAIRAFLQREGVPSAYVSVTDGSGAILQRGYGSIAADGPPPDASSVFPLGSISKQFTAATILALADSGKLRLDARVGDHLPEWFADEADLRITHLLSHTSGLADHLWLEGYRPLADDPATSIAAYVALAAAAPRRFAPGARWAYSNTNYKALALIIERVTRRPFDDVVAALVLQPAGIDGIAACHSLPANRIVPGVSNEGRPAPLDASRAAYAGDGGLCGSAVALARWLEVGFAGRNGLASRLARSVRLEDGTEVPYGFGISTRDFLGHPAAWHAGNVDGHSSMIAWLPDDDLRLIILTSRGFVWLTELMPALIGERPPGRGVASGAALTGRFEDGLFQYSVAPDADGMQVEIDLIGRFRFIPAGPREYIADEYPATFRIRLPPDGSRDAFEIDWGEVRSYARRARD